MRLVRKLYDWVLSWAETPYGGAALFLLALVESSFFPIPPDVLLIALCLSRPTGAWRFALLASVGSVCGGMIGYSIGWGLWHLVDDYFFAYVPGFSQEVFARVQQLFVEHNFLVVFTAGFTPIPYKVITIGAGLFEINFLVFALASVVSRSLRFYLVAWLLKHYGPGVRSFIERYFNWLSLLFVALLIGGFVLLKYAT